MAQLMLHRFFCRKSMQEYRVSYVILTCLFIAAKADEAPRRFMDICNVFDRVIKRHTSSPTEVVFPKFLAPETYARWDTRVQQTELLVLKELGYMVYCDLPHKFVCNFVNVLDLDQDCAQLVWNYCSDSMRTTLCVRVLPHRIACGCVYLAARVQKIALPNDWYLLFESSEYDCCEVAGELQLLYQMVNDCDENGDDMKKSRFKPSYQSVLADAAQDSDFTLFNDVPTR